MRRLHLRSARSLRWRPRLAAGLLLALVGCAGAAQAPLPATLRAAPPATEVPENWPAPPAEVERRLATEDFELREVKSQIGGTSGVLKVKLFFPAHGDSLDFKWKTATRGSLDGLNNKPRKELAAYAIQRWFLDEPEYVVPTSALRCLSIEALKAQDVGASPTLPGSPCVLGLLSVWLEDVDDPERLLDPRRFASDPVYAANLGRLNLFTYLVEHKDGREGNFLASESRPRRFFAVDNGISFDAVIQNWFVPNWDVIRVPALPHLEIERLRKVDRKEIDRLGVVAELHARPDGTWMPAAPGPNLDPEQGVRITQDSVQLGLTRSELDRVEARLHDLLARVDRGELRTF
jgi:hypothetical protein